MQSLYRFSTPLLFVYGAVVNAGAYGLFYYDKQQALKHRWRVPEKTLQLSALAGGWLGGMAAMNAFRHKTKKEPFRTIYFSCTALNIAGMAAMAAKLKRLPAGTANWTRVISPMLVKYVNRRVKI